MNVVRPVQINAKPFEVHAFRIYCIYIARVRGSLRPFTFHTSVSLATAPHTQLHLAGRGSSIDSVSAWLASCPELDHHVRPILSWRFGHEKSPTFIFPLPLIQEEQLSATSERTCTKY